MSLYDEIKLSLMRSLRRTWMVMKWFMLLMAVLLVADLVWRILR